MTKKSADAAPSPYLISGQHLIDMRLSAIPILPGEKRPGKFGSGEWRGMTGWEKYCDRLPTKIETDIWDAYPHAGVCIALGRGSNLTAIDLDYGSPEVRAAIEAILPPSPVRKTGAKGYTAFYQGSIHASRRFTVGDQSVIEILAHGKQTVMPPTIHPDGMAYRYITHDTLEDYPVSDLPTLPADFIVQIEKALAPFITESDIIPNTRTKWESAPVDSYWREINDRAMGDFSTWVPQLFPNAKRQGNGSYRVIAHWRNVANPNVCIHPDGITDWGAGQTHTPLDLVMSALVCDLEFATQWLKPKVGMTNVEPMLLLDIPTAPKAHDPEWDHEPPKASPYKPPVLTDPATASGFFDLDGVLGDMVEYMNKTARRAQPILAVGASLCALGSIMAHRYRTETNLRTNIYAVGIADSGSGKNHPREVITELFFAANLNKHLGGNKISSGAGLLTALHREPGSLFQLDEFGMFLKSAANRDKSPAHRLEIVDNMTELYSSAGTIFLGAEYANRDGKNERRDIKQPCLCVYGTTTPVHFWSALQSSSVLEGSLARFVVFISDDDYPDSTRRSGIRSTPQHIVEGLKAIAQGGSMGNAMLSDVRDDGTTIIDPMVVTMDDGAKELFEALDKEETSLLRKHKETIYTSLIARVAENSAKIALVRAVSFNPAKPIIREVDASWSIRLVRNCLQQVIKYTDRFVADNQTESNHKKVLEIIRKAGEITKGAIGQNTRWLDTRQRDDVLKALVESGDISRTVRNGVTKATTVYRVVSS